MHIYICIYICITCDICMTQRLMIRDVIVLMICNELAIADTRCSPKEGFITSSCMHEIHIIHMSMLCMYMSEHYKVTTIQRPMDCCQRKSTTNKLCTV